MKIYDTMIIGSGYASAGYAAAGGNTVICEEHQICDNGFYLPMRSFRYSPYSPKTEAGVRLKAIFDDLSLFENGMQNTNGFESAFCKYLTKAATDVLLKCRVIGYKTRQDDIIDVTVLTNEGLSHVFTKKILNSTASAPQDRITVLFTTDDIESDKPLLFSSFEDASVEPAFYAGRYALHTKYGGIDENTVKLLICRRWAEIGVKAKILYISPVFYGDIEPSNPLCDLNYEDPIQAFEAGYFCKKEGKI
ncbi:MAG: hypothetical protein E7634_00880 [Ruminococcaceae bacterium]|nr:hypothetical protein [Oscillospiraceae bacterium]